MADVATKCISGNPERFGGRAVTRIPGSRLFTHNPFGDQQYTVTALETKLTNRFDERAYYYDLNASGYHHS